MASLPSTAQLNTAQTTPASSNNETSTLPRKRGRVSRACDTCRRRKERCDGKEPACHRCTVARRPCSYYPSRKRGLQAGYLRSLEILLGLLVHSNKEATDLIRSVLHGGACELTAERVSPNRSLLDIWRESTALTLLHEALDGAVPGEDEEVHLQNLNEKWTSTFNTLPRSRKSASPIHRATSSREPCLFPDASTRSSDSPARSVDLPQAAIIDNPSPNLSLILPDDWPQLIGLYLTNTHSWLPIIQKFTLFRSANLLSKSYNSSKRLPSGDIVSLWAVLALGSYQNSVASTLATGQHQGASSTQLYTTAKALLLQNQLTFETGHIHASLVLALLDLDRGEWIDAWLLVGRALYIAVYLGIVPPENRKTVPTMDDDQKRLFIGCFVLDTVVAAALGVRPYLNRSDLRRIGTVSTDGLEEWESWCPIADSYFRNSSTVSSGRVFSTFNSLGHLAGLLNDFNRPNKSRDSMIREFMDWQKAIRLSDATHIGAAPLISDGGMPEEGIGSRIRPHILNLHVLAGAVYIMLAVPAQGLCTGQEQIGTIPLAANSVLQSTLNLMQSISKQDDLPKLSRSLPTMRAFLKLLERDRVPSSSKSFLPPDWASSAQQESPKQPLQPLPMMVDLAVSHPTDFLVPEFGNNELTATQRFGDQNVPSTGTDHLLLTLTDQNQHYDSTLTTSDELTAVQNPESPPSQTPRTVSDFSDGNVDHDGLFDELMLSDMGQWNNVSGDFMENLGLSRDATFQDIPGIIIAENNDRTRE
ncbi:hypothetical protein F4679DRAFT_86926 [Xylaria curta]|nr:hypothetical protein F4679DRAFT_86926 [Xylaria curta]